MKPDMIQINAMFGGSSSRSAGSTEDGPCLEAREDHVLICRRRTSLVISAQSQDIEIRM